MDFNVQHVGGEGQPAKNSTDEEVLAAAQKSNQVIVTRNHDMIMLCAERGSSVVWLDPYGRRLRLDEQAAMALSGIVGWCEVLARAKAPVCVRVLRSKVYVLPVAEGGALAERRYRAIQKRQARRRSHKPVPVGDALWSSNP